MRLSSYHAIMPVRKIQRDRREGAMISTSELRKGTAVILDGELLRVVEYQHVKQGRGSAFVRLNFRNVRSGAITTRTFQAGEKLQDVQLEKQQVQYLYR